MVPIGVTYGKVVKPEGTAMRNVDEGVEEIGDHAKFDALPVRVQEALG